MNTLMQISLAIVIIVMTATLIVCFAAIIVTLWEMIFDK